jgi:cytochrome c oxidase cbb3-type subunit 3
LVCLFGVLGCDRPPGTEGLREWNAADHDRTEETSKLRAGTQVTGDQPKDDSTLIEITWAQRCMQCHGPYGKGDGPNGPMVKAPDLTRQEWQARVSDAEIAERIRTGKGAMPASDLPPAVLEGLVARIRTYRDSQGMPQ